MRMDSTIQHVDRKERLLPFALYCSFLCCCFAPAFFAGSLFPRSRLRAVLINLAQRSRSDSARTRECDMTDTAGRDRNELTRRARRGKCDLIKDGDVRSE